MANTTSEIRRRVLSGIVKRDGLAETARRFKKPDRQINDMIQGRKAFGEKVAREMEANFDPNREPGWLDREVDHAPTPPHPTQLPPSSNSKGVIPRSHSGTTDASALIPLGQQEVIVVQVFDARGSMGLGCLRPEHDTVVDHMRLTESWVKTHLASISSPDNLAVLSAYGDSMEPTFRDGDILMVDRGISQIHLDAVYVLSLKGELYIKRVQRRITDGAIIIKSDNPLYDPVVVSNGERDELEVMGRVVWAWSGRKM